MNYQIKPPRALKIQYIKLAKKKHESSISYATTMLQEFAHQPGESGLSVERDVRVASM